MVAEGRERRLLGLCQRLMLYKEVQPIRFEYPLARDPSTVRPTTLY